jgi:hypothetical protein
MRRTMLLLACALAGALPLAAQTTAPLDSANTIGTTYHIHSSVLGEDRSYFVYAPPGAHGVASPVIVLLDGPDYVYWLTSAAVRILVIGERMPAALVVAVPSTIAARIRDFTPAIVSDTARRTAYPTAGGADRMLRFLADELLPEVERNYRTAPFRVLIGWSLEGLFAAYALLARPEVFQAYIAISPSMWWDHQRLTDSLVARLARQPQLRGWFYATIGGVEDPVGMMAPFLRVERAFREHAPPTLEWRFTVLAGEDHYGTPYRSIHGGLDAIFRPFRALPPDSVRALGIAGLDRRYAEMRARFGSLDQTPEPALNTLGFLLLADTQASHHALALDAFRENGRRFPHSANVYDSMGDAFRTLGQKEAALTCFAASVRTGLAFPDEGDPLGSEVAPNSLRKMGEVARELDRPAWTPGAIPERVAAECLAGQAR